VIVKRLNDEINRAMEAAELRKRVTATGGEAISTDSAIFAKTVAGSTSQWHLLYVISHGLRNDVDLRDKIAASKRRFLSAQPWTYRNTTKRTGLFKAEQGLCTKRSDDIAF
jgi:hypothetical protein